jgi:hypothetical protein
MLITWGEDNEMDKQDGRQRVRDKNVNKSQLAIATQSWS